MFDIGFWEMLVIGVMALVVLGPERLPGAIRSTMNTIRSIKNVANGFKQEVSSQLDAHELHANLKKAEALGMQNLGKDLQNSVDQLKAAAASVQQPYKKKPATDPAKNEQNTQKPNLLNDAEQAKDLPPKSLPEADNVQNESVDKLEDNSPNSTNPLHKHTND
jgi:sec-independent protein translocase protein TatB